MPVLLFDSTSTFHATWAGQWQRADPNNRRTVPISGSGSHEQLRDVIVKAVRLAGQTAFNELILAVGHGGGTQAQGLVDLAPSLRMRLARGTIGDRDAKGTEIFYDPFYDFVVYRQGLKPQSDKTQDEAWARQKDRANQGGAKFRLGRSAIYQSIGTAIQNNHINQVVFMTCNIGNATDFIKKIAFDWKVKIKAYKQFIIFQLNVGGKGKTRAFFLKEMGSVWEAISLLPKLNSHKVISSRSGHPSAHPHPREVLPRPLRKKFQACGWMLTAR